MQTRGNVANTTDKALSPIRLSFELADETDAQEDAPVDAQVDVQAPSAGASPAADVQAPSAGASPRAVVSAPSTGGACTSAPGDAPADGACTSAPGDAPAEVPLDRTGLTAEEATQLKDDLRALHDYLLRLPEDTDVTFDVPPWLFLTEGRQAVLPIEEFNHFFQGASSDDKWLDVGVITVFAMLVSINYFIMCITPRYRF